MTTIKDALRGGVGAWLACECAWAEPQQAELPVTTVVANRIETPLEDVGSAYSLLETEALGEAGIVALEDALRLVPGTVPGSEGGQRGSISALRLRGTEADHALVLVDGMRVTDANITPFNFLGGESLFGLSRIEVLRGPQGALYGSEAIGGVVSLDTRTGTAAGPRTWTVEAGSFDSFRSGAQFQGELEGMRWFLGGSYEQTANDRDDNDFEQWQTALRLEGEAGAATTAGVTFRSWTSEFENPGSAGPFASRAVDDREASLFTGYLEHLLNPSLTTKVVAGYYREDFEELGAFPFESSGEKFSLDWRNTWRIDEGLETVIGGLAEWTSFQSTATPVDEESWHHALYANAVWEPVREVTLSLGGRYSHYERWDDVVTWRATANWHMPIEGLRLRGSYGTGYRTPSFFELFGAIPSLGFFGNPDLEEERSRGWDLGVEWSPCGQILVGVTWFENRIEDLIDFTPANVGEVTTRGVELEAAGTAWDDRIEWRLVHTWLDTEDEDTGLELVRRPEHSTSFDLRGRPCAELLLGVGGSWVSGTLDNDFSTFPAVRRELDDYVLLRIYGRYAFNETIAVHGRIENLLDDDYEEIANFPGRGLGFYAGFTVSW